MGRVNIGVRCLVGAMILLDIDECSQSENGERALNL